VRNEELQQVKDERIILQIPKRRKANWIGYILRRNCLLNHVIEGKIEGRIKVTGRLRRRRKQLLYDLKEKRGYCQLKEEALDCTVWRKGGKTDNIMNSHPQISEPKEHIAILYSLIHSAF
jgi:hypothetical protein